MDVVRMVTFLEDAANDMEVCLAYECMDVPPTENPPWIAQTAETIDWLRLEVEELQKHPDWVAEMKRMEEAR